MKKIRSGFEDLKTVILLACIDPWPEASHDQIGQVQSYSPLVVCRRDVRLDEDSAGRIWCGWRVQWAQVPWVYI